MSEKPSDPAISCDICGSGLLIDDDVRYVVEIDVYAAYDPLEITQEDLNRDLEKEREQIIEQLRDKSKTEARDEVHRSFEFHLCPECQSEYIKHPLSGAEDQKGPTSSPPG